METSIHHRAPVTSQRAITDGMRRTGPSNPERTSRGSIEQGDGGAKVIFVATRNSSWPPMFTAVYCQLAGNGQPVQGAVTHGIAQLFWSMDVFPTTHPGPETIVGLFLWCAESAM